MEYYLNVFHLVLNWLHPTLFKSIIALAIAGGAAYVSYYVFLTLRGSTKTFDGHVIASPCTNFQLPQNLSRP